MEGTKDVVIQDEAPEAESLEDKGTFGPTSFQDLDAIQEAQETRAKVMTLTDQFLNLVNNIMIDPEIEDKGTAVMSLAGDFAARVQANAKKDADGPSVKDRLKSLLGIETKDEPPVLGDSPFTVWKEGDATYWMAIFTNNYRDSDNPPEILSSKSHQDFVDAVDKGEWPYPELWLWHVEKSRWGETIQLAYDETTGFTIAVGQVDKGKEHIAEALAKLDDIAVSHGMPSKEIERDEDDPTIIVRYRSREISPLPIRAAANKATGFHILKESVDMLPENKKAFLESVGIDVEAVEADLQARKEELEAAGVESKEETQEPLEETPVEESKDETTDVEPIEEPIEVDLAAQLADAITLAVETAVAPLVEEIAGLKEANAALEAKQVKQSEDLLGMSPPQSLAEMLSASVIGKGETKVDGRSSEAKDGPKETDPNENIKGLTTGIPFVDAMRQGKDWRETFPASS